MLRLILVDTLRRVHHVGFLGQRLIYVLNFANSSLLVLISSYKSNHVRCYTLRLSKLGYTHRCIHICQVSICAIQLYWKIFNWMTARNMKKNEQYYHVVKTWYLISECLKQLQAKHVWVTHELIHYSFPCSLWIVKSLCMVCEDPMRAVSLTMRQESIIGQVIFPCIAPIVNQVVLISMHSPWYEWNIVENGLKTNTTSKIKSLEVSMKNQSLTNHKIYTQSRLMTK